METALILQDKRDQFTLSRFFSKMETALILQDKECQSILSKYFSIQGKKVVFILYFGFRILDFGLIYDWHHLSYNINVILLMDKGRSIYWFHGI